MEVTIAWFWLVKLAIAFIAFGFMYKAYKAKFQSKFWNLSVGIIAILYMANPIKMEATTAKVNATMNHSIAQSKALPEKVTDNSFSQSTKIDGIKPTDLN